MNEVARLFSARAEGYARYRPNYPTELFEWLASHCPHRRCALDLGAGSGQASQGLASYFDHVLASDASEAQLRAGRPWGSITPFVADAPAQPLPDACVALITVGQALHWFATPAFFAEVRRLLVPGGLFAAWCYALVRITPAVDALIDTLHSDTLASYWPPGRESVDAGYRDIAVPFATSVPPVFALTANWHVDDLLGYLRTWSAVERWSARHGEDPVAAVEPAIRQAWGDQQSRQARWPLHWIIGRPEE